MPDDYRKSMNAVYRRPGFLLKRCHQVSAAIFMEECGSFNMTPSQYGALCVLSEHSGLDQIALARLSGQDRSTIGLVIKLLEKRHLITRNPHPLDKRRIQINITANGRGLLAEMEPAAQRAKERVLAALPADSHPLFLGLLEAFLAGHNAIIDPDEILASS